MASARVKLSRVTTRPYSYSFTLLGNGGEEEFTLTASQSRRGFRWFIVLAGVSGEVQTTAGVRTSSTVDDLVECASNYVRAWLITGQIGSRSHDSSTPDVEQDVTKAMVSIRKHYTLS